MAENLHIMIKGKVFGKQDFKIKEDQYGQKISFNIESQTAPIVIGESTQPKAVKAVFFPSFSLGKTEKAPDTIKVGKNLIMSAGIGFKAGKEMGEDKDFVLNDGGYRVDNLKNLKFDFVTFETKKKGIIEVNAETSCNVATGILIVEMAKALESGPKKGTSFLLSETYTVPNVSKDDPDKNAKMFRKKYYRAYCPNIRDFKAGSQIVFKGCVINNPFIEKDMSPMIYIDTIFN